MEMPFILRQVAEELTVGLKQNTIKQNAETLSRRYRDKTLTARSVTGEQESVAYAVARMPATFGAAANVLEKLAQTGLSFESLTDVGAGTGAVAWAACGLFSFKSVLCLEYEPAMRKTGQHLTGKGEAYFDALPRWQAFDLRTDAIEQSDLVTAAYVLNELPPAEQTNALAKLWQATRKALVVIEPATPENFEQIKAYRQFLIRNGAFIAAPCPHHNDCPEQWCHFACRVARSKLHRALKGGSAPFEDEKFTYLIAARQPLARPNARIVRRPLIEKSKVTLELCAPDGRSARLVAKKDDGYKSARKADWGDGWDD